MSGKLSTHILDTASGRPAGGVAIELWYCSPSDTREGDDHAGQLIARAATNTDGRTDSPLLDGDTIRAGVWRLVFRIGDYYRARRHPDAGLFLDRVVVEFTIADPTSAYHVPLLVTPWSYSTYRGS